MTLQWSNPERRVLALEQSGSLDFQEVLVRYEGTDQSSVLTGLEEGRHYFRLRAAGAAPGAEVLVDPVSLEVKFFPRGKLFVLLGLGALVVVATIGTILIGGVRTRTGEVES